MNFDTNEDDIQEYFGECGEITQVKLLKRADGKSRGRGFVKFTTNEAAVKAIELNDSEFMGRRIVVQYPQNKSFNSEKFYQKVNNDGSPESANIIIRNLSFKTSEDDLYEMFDHCGKIKRARIILNEEGQSRGFGFVDFEEVESARTAMNKNGEKFNGRDMRIDFSLPREFRND